MEVIGECNPIRLPNHVEKLRVRFSDCDAGKIVHHSNLFRWLEEARLGLLRAIGVSYRSIEKDGIHFPLTACSATFSRPLRSEDQIEISLWLCRLSRARMEFYYQVAINNDVAATATTSHAIINDEGRPIRLQRDADLWARLSAGLGSD